MPTSHRAVYLHIGPPKTGTTYLQDVLWRNRDRLASNGVAVPGARQVDHFHAALDLRGIAFGGFDNPETAGAWPRLVRRIGASPSPRIVVSHEVLAGADEAQIAKIVTDLDDADAHVVYGSRDLARQLPAVWQESLKNRRTRAFQPFLKRALEAGDGGTRTTGFWRAQNVLGTLGRWSDAVPPDRIHVVTLPPADAAPDTLWRRFCQVLDIGAEGYDLDVARTNPSLSAVDAEMLRRLNAALPPDLPWPEYEVLVKRRFNSRADAGHAGGRLLVPREHRDRVLELTRQTQAGLSASGFDIVGSLDDLTPAETSFGALADVSPDMVTEAAVALLADVLTDSPMQHITGGSRSAAKAMLGQLRRVRRTP